MMHYIVGIDVGTTNCAATYIDLSLTQDDAPLCVETFEIPQLTAPGEVSRLKVLPSFLYLPGRHEFNKDGLGTAWSADDREIAGAFARDQGVKVPQRLIASAKSWLCHDKVDRHAPILPWGAEDPVEKRSPVDVTAAYLRHIKSAWNLSKKGDEPHYLENQTVIITVPASFDEVARDLTVEAASRAGLTQIALLEEPLAAFYCWLHRHASQWRQFVRPGDLILVCDVGGGTTDFTLITLQETDGLLLFERIAVGDHLMLGGDNMDLSLAHVCEARLTEKKGGRLGALRWQSLCSQCRQAKEALLSDPSESKPITLVGEGGRLIRDTVSTSLSPEEVHAVILDGFFPLVDPTESLSQSLRQGMSEFGLPYARDPAITRHLIRFLEQHGNDVARRLGRNTPEPDLMLFNGAALKPSAVQERIREAVSKWFGNQTSQAPRILVNPEFEIAVARGASYYGAVKTGKGIRVESGSARAYFLGVCFDDNTHENESAVDGSPDRAVCLVRRGMPEGARTALKNRKFHVLANQPVRFYVYSSSFRTGDQVGDVVEIDDTLSPLPPLHTVIQFGKKAVERTVPVEVEVHYTEAGTLALWCRAVHSPHRWRFQFQLRQADPSQTMRETSIANAAVFEESLVDQALQAVRYGFSAEAEKQQTLRLVKTMADTVNQPKEQWPLYFIRRIADELFHLTSIRNQSFEHEARWLNLMGFCMRPGFGEILDEKRIQNLWKMFRSGPVHAKEVQVRSEWWVLWRRVAGGLSANQQRIVLQETGSLLWPKKGMGKSRIGPQEHMEIWMAVANLERVSVSDKAEWGARLLNSLKPKKSRSQYWWALSRIAAREPLYGPIDRVVSPEVVTQWINTILSVKWRGLRPVGAALAQMARLTGDRKRDLKPEVVQRVLDWLRPHEWSSSHVKPLEGVVPIAPHEEGLIFGESLPSGLRLRHLTPDDFQPPESVT